MKEWLSNLVRDMGNATESFSWSLPPYGLVGSRAVDRMPKVGEPALLYFPPPYHPLAVLAAMRGWGGTNHGDPDRPISGAQEVRRVMTLPTWGESITAIGRTLFLSPARSYLFAHIVCPVEPMGYDGDVLKRIKVARRKILAQLAGATESVVRDIEFDTGHGRLYSTAVPEFWKIVEPEIAESL